MPTPNKDESRTNFISRCIGCDEMNSKFPNQKQRIAVCYSYAEKYFDKKSIKEHITFKQYLDQ